MIENTNGWMDGWMDGWIEGRTVSIDFCVFA